MNWQLQEAFSQVVREAQEHGPQVITVGKDVVRADEFQLLFPGDCWNLCSPRLYRALAVILTYEVSARYLCAL